MTLGGAISRMVSVLMMTARIGASLDEFHRSVPSFEDEKLAAGSKMGRNVDSIVRWYRDLHV